MKRLLLLFATRILPGLIILGGFVAGHATVAPDTSALETFRNDRATRAEAAITLMATGGPPLAGPAPASVAGLALAGGAPLAMGGTDQGATNPEASSADADADTEAEAEAEAGDSAGVTLPPVYRYFSFDAPFAGNADQRGSLFTMELALSTRQSPLVADLFLTRLQEMQPTLRGVILSEIADVSASDLREISARAAFCDRLREVLNAYLVENGGAPDIVEVIITSFVIT